jgi:hypothetical protein
VKGKREFSESEANQIRKLIGQKLIASKTEQKLIRNKIRSFEFYFSDFSSKKGYTVQDFENLIKSGEIKIVGQEKIINKQKNKEPKKNPQSSIIDNLVVENNDIENELIVNGKFCTIKDLNQSVLNSTGFYCIRLKENSELPLRYQNILNKRKYKFIYIGKAEGQTLRERLNQELELKSPGTFFRSIGCVLKYLPIKGHLKGKANQNNFKFSPDAKSEIIQWLRNNIELSIAKHSGDFKIESELIGKYCPLLNDTHNPMKLQELKEDKDRCRKIARE